MKEKFILFKNIYGVNLQFIRVKKTYCQKNRLIPLILHTGCTKNDSRFEKSIEEKRKAIEMCVLLYSS